MWRPDNWRKVRGELRAQASSFDGEHSYFFEAGADAILEELLKAGFIDSEILRKVPWGNWENIKDGKWVFIPQEE